MKKDQWLGGMADFSLCGGWAGGRAKNARKGRSGRTAAGGGKRGPWLGRQLIIRGQGEAGWVRTGGAEQQQDGRGRSALVWVVELGWGAVGCRGLGRKGLRWTHSCPREARGWAVAVSQRGKATERLGKVKRATGRIIWLPRTGGGTIGCA